VAAIPPPNFSIDLKYGVLVGLTGDAASGGQAWNQAVRVAIDDINQKMARAGVSQQLKVELSDSQDSEGDPQHGVEAAQKLVTIDKVNVVIGDLFSSVTSAVAPSVTVPNKVLEFTGGANPSLTKLNSTNGPTYLWQAVAADDLQGKVLAQIMGDALGKTATVNLGIRNDAYGTGLGGVFEQAWTAQGGKIGKYVTYNPTQPTFDTEAQQLVDGSPDGWLFVDFCQTWAKLVGPLQRTGKWDGTKTFGSDALTDCGGSGGVPEAAIPGMRTVQANTSAGSSFGAYQQLFTSQAQGNVTFSAFTAEAFDSVFVAFLAAIAAHSTDSDRVSPEVVYVTNPPGTDYSFLQLDQAVRTLLAGQRIHFNGASGPLNFEPGGRVTATAYDIWLVGQDGKGSVSQTISFNG
jgi:branched-chain amino acid transport system substrate-binding protein